MDRKTSDQIVSIIGAVDDLTIYFGTAKDGQKASNIARNNKVSVTINQPYESWDDVVGLSVGATATEVSAPEEMEKFDNLIFRRFPQVADYAPTDARNLAIFRLDPVVISLVDYRKRFGNADLVEV